MSDTPRTKAVLDALAKASTELPENLNKGHVLAFFGNSLDKLAKHANVLETELSTKQGELDETKRQLWMANDAAQKGEEGRKMGTAYEECQKELDAMQVQRDQLSHLLTGGTLTEQQVIESGLGAGVLIEQRHHEAMRCKAEQKLDAMSARVEKLTIFVKGITYYGTPVNAYDFNEIKLSAKQLLSTLPKE